MGSGQPYTPFEAIYVLDLQPTLQYGLRNSARLPMYHRLDISATFRLTKKGKPFESELVISAYNVYNRQNVFFTYTDIESDPNNGEVSLQSYQVSLFPIIPSATFNFRWKQPKKGYYKEQRAARQARRAGRLEG